MPLTLNSNLATTKQNAPLFPIDPTQRSNNDGRKRESLDSLRMRTTDVTTIDPAATPVRGEGAWSEDVVIANPRREGSARADTNRVKRTPWFHQSGQWSMWGNTGRYWRRGRLGRSNPMASVGPRTPGTDAHQSFLFPNGSGWRTHQRRSTFLPRDRGNQSFYVVVFFAVLFACIVTFEVFFIDEDGGESTYSHRFDFIQNGVGGPFNPEDDQLQDFDLMDKFEPQLQMVRQLTDDESKRPSLTGNGKQQVPPAAGSSSAQHPAPEAGETPSPSADQIPSSEFISSKTQADNWQPVTGTREKFYVYAAYYDGRRGRFIRVISATRTRGSDRVLCKYWYTNGDPPVIVGATNKVIRENWNLKYSAHFVMCPLFLYNVGRTVNVPDEVSVLARPGDEPGNKLKVRNLWAAHARPADAFAVCVKPLHYQFNRALQLIEFVEFNRLLGVEHFTLYNHTVGKDVACVLNQYQEERVVSLLPWQLNMVSQKEIRTEGLFAALNDCLYRNMYRYRYLLMIDLDEFIVPHRNDSLRSMVSSLTERVDHRKVGSFSFMNSFFYLQWPNDTGTQSLSLPLVTLTKTRRRSKFHPHKQRSKCIVLPEFVIEMGNHFVWEFLPGRGTVNAPPDVGFLHHYRVCEFGGSDCIKAQWVTDRTVVHKFRDDILERVHARLDSLQKTCGTLV